MITINQLWIELRPSYFSEGGDVLTVRVQVNGSRVVLVERLLCEDDLTTRFDYMFDVLREELRGVLKAGIPTSTRTRTEEQFGGVLPNRGCEQEGD